VLRPFTIHEPTSVEEAIHLLAEFGNQSRIYAGGTELLLIMKEGLARFDHLINIKTIPGLNDVEFRDGWLRMGPCVTHRMIECSEVIRERYPCLAEVARLVANIRVRNVGTIGGNLCFAEPHSDPAVMLLVCDAVVVISGIKGERSLPVKEFILGPLETILDDTEILTQIKVPALPPGMKAAYVKFGYYERPTIGAACGIKLERDRRIQEIRFAVGSVGEIPRRLTALEGLFIGKNSEEAITLIPQAAGLAYDQVKPESDFHGSSAYKRQLIKVFLERAFLSACGKN
jgi:aerobic carbon-monoxide dehydrogenase medium subunit